MQHILFDGEWEPLLVDEVIKMNLNKGEKKWILFLHCNTRWKHKEFRTAYLKKLKDGNNKNNTLATMTTTTAIISMSPNIDNHDKNAGNTSLAFLVRK